MYTPEQARGLRLIVDYNVGVSVSWMKAHDDITRQTVLPWDEVVNHQYVKGAQRIVYVGEYTYTSIAGRDYELPSNVAASLRYWLDQGKTLTACNSRNGVPIVYVTN